MITHINSTGDVTINGNPAPTATQITATVNGGGSDLYITTVSGKYGSGISTDFDSLLVKSVGEDSTIEEGAPITFYINNVPAEVYEVGKGPWMPNYPFKQEGETSIQMFVPRAKRILPSLWMISTR